MINLVAITFASTFSTLVFYFQSNTVETVALILWDKPSFPPINSVKICWRINSVISEYIRYIAESIQVDTYSYIHCLALSSCLVHRFLVASQGKMCGKNNGDSPTFVACSVYI